MALSATELGAALDGRWGPGIGDPTFVGWATVVAYSVGAHLAFLAYRASGSGRQRLDPIRPHEAINQRLLAAFWLLACLTLAGLGINKQLDLQSLFTETMRDVAHVQGWYDDRRRFQAVFVVAIASAGLLGAGALAWLLRHVRGRLWMAVLGLCWITSFVVIRAASFHHVGVWPRGFPPGWNAAFELSGIAMIGAGAGWALHSGRRLGIDTESRRR